MTIFRPITLIRLGLALFVLGFGYSVFHIGIPYQDPTPEMLAYERFHGMIGDRILLMGIALFVSGCLWGLVRRLR
ncbi:hypothetical protein [Roseinatronobacter ekhonensis]|jgi:hypothetical protein|nr:hypothetical protein [Roseibaca ekhonensis]